jgi:hypothetical protein
MEKILSILVQDAGQWLLFYSHKSLGSGGTTIQKQLIHNP